ncbi:MAG: antibiotic biosynthesis monooxygenase family protein [Flavobacteriales bacterium]|jgi:quinol monooxygenase YgiN|nr:antibiotic biosynthesis monooxygenase family protein [Flavobacteriales bacterium]
MRTILSTCLVTICVLAFAGRGNAQAPAPAVVVTVDYHALPGKGDALVAALRLLLAEVRMEPHYLDITVLRDRQNAPDRVLLVERWDDLAYYTGAHGNTPHLEAFKTSAMSLLAGPPAVTLWPDVQDVGKP